MEAPPPMMTAGVLLLDSPEWATPRREWWRRPATCRRSCWRAREKRRGWRGQRSLSWWCHLSSRWTVNSKSMSLSCNTKASLAHALLPSPHFPSKMHFYGLVCGMFENFQCWYFIGYVDVLIRFLFVRLD